MNKDSVEHFMLFISGLIIGSILSFSVLYFFFYLPQSITQGHEGIEGRITKSITIKKLFTENEVDAMGGPFSGYAVVSTEGIGYWTSSDVIFLGFEVDKTYCVNVSPNLPQGPIINQNFGEGECK